MITCVAVDDEPMALEIIKSHTAKIDFLNLMATFSNPFHAIEFINEHKPSLVVLDINMPDLNGINLLQHVHYKPLVVFTTAHSEYAIKSYDVDAVDYLLKPFDFSRYLIAVNKVRNVLNNQRTTFDFFFVNTGNQKQKLFYNEILYISGEGNYVFYHTLNNQLLVRASVSETLAQLPGQLFVQIHRSTIINLYHIDKIADNHVHINHLKLQIGAKYRDVFLKRVNL